jgi:uncharacterized protein YbaR (Trm112 family)
MKPPKPSEETTNHHGPREIEPKFLEMLACPLTKGPLRWDADKAELISLSAKLAYPVRDGIPIMLPSEARQLEDDEFGR